MNAWWVNHKQTFQEEIEGGFIWAPQRKKNGSKNVTYEHLTQTQVSDRVFSYAHGLIKAIGTVSQECVTAQRPAAFKQVGNQWNEEGYLVKIVWTVLDVALSPKAHLNQIAPLLPGLHSPIKPSTGDGNQNCYLASIGPQLDQLLMSLCQDRNSSLDEELDDAKSTVAEVAIQTAPIPTTTKDQLIKARVGQGIFKKRVQSIESKCRLTHVSDDRFLVASHIKPWRDCNNEERLDGSNGLLLAPHVDRLFDQGWLSFTDEGQILIADQSIKIILDAWQVDYSANAGSFSKAQRIYLNYHRDYVFKKDIYAS